MDLITTVEAKCRDCYKCVRTCPVKAIAVNDVKNKESMHVQIISELCIKCGHCILSCPQNAKKLTTYDFEQVQKLLEAGEPLACSVAPSFPAAVPLGDPLMLPTLLRRLGFKIVEETSVGAELVSRQHLKIGFDKPIISSSCPTIVNLIERYYSELLPMLAPIVPPVVAHARLIKSKHPGYKVVFIGPCLAKKDKEQSEATKDAVDFALGFDELWELARLMGIRLNDLTPSKFDNPPSGVARMFPLEGGMLKCVSSGLGDIERDYFAVSGLEECISYLERLISGKEKYMPKLIELLACKGGCINGPLILSRKESIYYRKLKVLDYHRAYQDAQEEFREELPDELMQCKYRSKDIYLPYPSEAELRMILEKTGKYSQEDELNCGACGYDTCQEKAIAVFHGKAELQMCIPYMRKRAESLSSVVTASMPSGLIIVDQDMTVLEMNPAAEKMFKYPARHLIGKKLDNLIPADNFIRVMNSGESLSICSDYPHRDLVTREYIFPVENEKIVVGIFVDITANKREREQFELIKNQTIAKAQEVIEKQMTVAQEIAGLLGEATAESKIHLTRLINLMRADPAREE